MRVLKRFLLATVFIPFIAVAQLDYTYSNVSPGCYGAFRSIFSMLPEITDAMNEKAGEDIIVISSTRTPLANPSTFTMTVDYTIGGNGVGNYKLYQHYVGTDLYLRIDQMPDTIPTGNLDALWMLGAKIFAGCPL